MPLVRVRIMRGSELLGVPTKVFSSDTTVSDVLDKAFQIAHIHEVLLHPDPPDEHARVGDARRARPQRRLDLDPQLAAHPCSCP